MPYSRFCSVHDASLVDFLADFEKVILDRDLERWSSFFQQLSSLAPARRLVKGPSLREDYLIDTATPILEGFSPNEVPPANFPRLYLLMQRLLHLTARHFLHGRDDGFNGTFCEGLSKRIQPGAEQGQHQLLIETIFLSREPLVGPLRFLANPDTAHSYVRLDRLRMLLQAEEEVGLLGRLAQELRSGKGLDRIYGEEIERMLRFFQLLEAEGLGLYYWEYPT